MDQHIKPSQWAEEGAEDELMVAWSEGSVSPVRVGSFPVLLSFDAHKNSGLLFASSQRNHCCDAVAGRGHCE